MATNPRIPESFEPEKHRRSELRPERPSSGIPGVALAIIAAIAILAAILYFMPRAPKVTAPPTNASVPAQPTGSQLQIKDLQISTAPTGGSMYLQGQVNNQGTQDVTGVAVEVTMRGQDGAVVHQQSTKMMGLEQGQGTSFKELDFTDKPLKSNETRPFRVAVDNVPQTWNHQMPDLRIVTVTATK
jgi:hypothetical protein